MTPAARRLLGASHAWAGAVAGLAVFIVCVTGVWAVADAHLRYWEAGFERVAPVAAFDLDRLLAAAGAQGVDTRNARITLPSALQRTVTIGSAGHGPKEGTRGPAGALQRVRLDPATATALPDDAPGMAAVVTTLHKNLHLGFGGRIAVSLVGVAMTVLLLGGIVLHARRWRDRTVLRLTLGARVALMDLHRLAGLWLLPVLLLIAVTGAFSGTGVLGTMAMSRFVYPGGMPQALAELTGHARSAPPAGVSAPMRPVQALLDAQRRRDPSFQVESMVLSNWGDAEAALTLSGTRAGLLSTAVFERVRYRGRDGALVREEGVQGRGVWLRAFVAVQPLHFAQYGQGWGLALHVLGGLGAAVLAATGTLMWLRRGLRPGDAVPWVACGVVGVGGGLLMACGALLLATACGLSLTLWQHAVFWAGWAAGAGVSAGACRRGRATALVPVATGVLLLAASLADLARSVAQPLPVAAPAWRVDAFLFFMGAVLLALGLRFRVRAHGRSKELA